jgi:hypothetical protein
MKKITKKLWWVLGGILVGIAIAMIIILTINNNNSISAVELDRLLAEKDEIITAILKKEKANNEEISILKDELKAKRESSEVTEIEYLDRIASLKKKEKIYQENEDKYKNEIKSLEECKSLFAECRINFSLCIKDHELSLKLGKEKDGIIDILGKNLNLSEQNYILCTQSRVKLNEKIGLQNDRINTLEKKRFWKQFWNYVKGGAFGAVLTFISLLIVK